MNNERFIGGEDGGVPCYIFNGEFFSNKIIKGLSGNFLFVNVYLGVISIVDLLPNSPCHFIAQVSDNVLSFDIVTKGFKGFSFTKHPDLYAGKLMEESFNFFEKKNLIKKIQISLMYDPQGIKTSDYYLELISATKSDNPNEEELLKAASILKGFKIFRDRGFEPKSLYKNNLGNFVNIIIEFEQSV